MKTQLVFLLVLMHCFGAIALACSPDSLEIRDFKAIYTDNTIDLEFQNHQVFINTDCISNDKLLLHLVGTFDNPASTTFFPSLAANNGFKVVVLKYPNNISGTSACRNSADVDCHWKYRQEIIFGTDTSAHVAVDTSNSIVNRFQKLLMHLDSLHPLENWDQFLNNQNSIDWSRVQVSGHSQGGGHAAFIAKRFSVDRALLFAAPNEYSAFYSAPASWIDLPSVTPDSNYYAFGNVADDIVDFNEQYLIWESMQMLALSDSINVDNTSCPYNYSRVLYTEGITSTTFSENHNLVVIDDFTLLDAGVPVFIPVWEYMLGLCAITTSISNIDVIENEVSIFPNPVTDVLHIKSKQKILRIEVIDPVGKIIETFNPNHRVYNVNVNRYEGLLLFRCFFENQVISTTKIIII